MQRNRRAAFPPQKEDLESTADEDSTTDEEEDGGGGGVQVGSHVRPARHQQRPAKRLKRDDAAPTAVADDVSDRSGNHGSTPLRSLEKRVSPPATRETRASVTFGSDVETEDEDEVESKKEKEDGSVQHVAEAKNIRVTPTEDQPEEASSTAITQKGTTFVSSPIQLTRIRDLPPAANIDTVALRDIVGDPLIVEMWQFNYMFDVDFLMGSLDEDVRSSMRLKVVHGSWRREDVQRQMLEECAKQYPNLEVIQAYMPEAFGTHHSKMMILIRADDSAQIVIHTANMIAKDWTNMTNAVWRSPLLPLLPENTSESTAGNNANESSNIKYSIGTGQRFKVDLLRYLSAYGKRLASLTKQLVRYDFSVIRAALVASAPRRVKLDERSPDEHTSWGWVGLREILSHIPLTLTTRPSKCMTVAQVSSIATLDQAGAWLKHFRSVLESSREAPSSPSSSPSTTSPAKLANSFSSFQPASEVLRPTTGEKSKPLDFRIIFPSVTDVRTSIDGYRAGGSIHFKMQSAAQLKQLAYMRPRFCRWNTNKNPTTALRSSAAPHVKTYVRYAMTTGDNGVEQTTIDWAMLTSANLSTQAWGALPAAVKTGDGEVKKKGKDKQDGENGKEVRICSWEIGVVVWPALLAEVEEGKEAMMLPVFGRDMPEVGDLRSDYLGGEKVVVGWRMPYDLPLTPYAENEEPWSATTRYDEPDVKGCIWEGF